MSPPQGPWGAGGSNGASTATVASTSPLKVSFDGQSAQVAARTLTTYTPVLNDRVATIPLDGGSRRLILGKIT